MRWQYINLLVAAVFAAFLPGTVLEMVDKGNTGFCIVLFNTVTFFGVAILKAIEEKA